MKASMTIVCSALVLALCAMVESKGYGGHSSYPANQASSGYGSGAMATGSGYGASGHGSRSNSAYGPYHSYAVRPVVYGGHGLYSYRGYARHAPAPAPANNAHLRYARSYSMNAGRCSGYNCQQQHGQAAHMQYGWRPVKALAIAPARSYGSNHGSYGRQMSYGHGSGAARGNYRAAGSHHAGAASAGRYHQSAARGYNRAARGHGNRGGNRSYGSAGGY